MPADLWFLLLSSTLCVKSTSFRSACYFTYITVQLHCLLLQKHSIGTSRWGLWNHYLFSGQFEPRPVDKYTCDMDWAVVLRVLKRVSSAEQLLDESIVEGLSWAEVQQLRH